MSIQILDSTIANRISAGEVVERPASIVKELIDNAIDAKAKHINIEIQNGGIDYIRISDDGCGIDEEDLKKAFLPHATSKIKSLEDLDNIFTLGFRGEALASIAAVSQVTMKTKTQISDVGSTIDVNGGEFGDVKNCASVDGTTIEVKNLFYNTPARRKFLKRPKQEENEITNIVSRFILANPEINFKYFADDKLIFSNEGKNLLDAICCVYGEETKQHLLEVKAQSGNLTLTGYVGKTDYTKPNTTYQTLLVNDRYVIDETISKAVYIAFEEFLMTRQFPFFVLNLKMPFTEVDVNVHPSKMNIKFANPNEIFDLVYHAVRSAIYGSVSNNKIIEEDETTLPEEENEIEILVDESANNAQNDDINEDVHSAPSVEIKSDPFDETPKDEIIYDTDFDNKITFRQSFGNNISMFDKYATNKNTFTDDEPVEDENFIGLSDFKVIGEIFSEFLILEKDDKMIMLDFHAGHERLLYDKFLNLASSRQVVVQDLLIPYIQTVTEKELDYILSFRDELEKLGFSVDQFSPREVRVSSVPLMLKDINLKEFLDDLLNDINNPMPRISYQIDSYLAKSACRSAVKAGQTLNDMQIHELLKNLDLKKPILQCPHGRPIVTIISREQIEKWFKRIVE